MSGHLTKEEKEQWDKDSLAIKFKEFLKLKKYLRDNYIAFSESSDSIILFGIYIYQDLRVFFGTGKVYQYTYEKILIKIHHAKDNNVPKAGEPGVKLVPGLKVAGNNFILVKRIDSLDEFWDVLNTEKSFFARHKMYPTAFFFSWQIKSISEWLRAGCFWTTKPS